MSLIRFALALSLAIAAHATLLPVNSTVSPDAQANPLTDPSATFVGGISSPYNASSGGNSISGSYQEFVFLGFSGNPFGASSLTFVLQVSLTDGTNASGGGPILERVSDTSYLSVQTDVGYFQTAAHVIPATADRSSDGSVVGFNFTSPGASIQLGQNSAMMIINTNAKRYSETGTLSIQGDGISTDRLVFAPVAPFVTPEPGSILLLTGGLVAIALLRRSRITPGLRAKGSSKSGETSEEQALSCQRLRAAERFS